MLWTRIYSLMCNTFKPDKCIMIVVVGSKSNLMIFFTLISGTSIIMLNSSYDTTSLTNDSVIICVTCELVASEVVPLLFFFQWNSLFGYPVYEKRLNLCQNTTIFYFRPNFIPFRWHLYVTAV